MESIFDNDICARCKGRGYCGKPCKILARIQHLLPKTKLHFSGSSPPEVFVGRIGYPNINTGILSPQEYGSTEEMSMPEIWHSKSLSIQEILNHRSQLIYARFKSQVSDARKATRFLGVMQEISMAEKPSSIEVFLKKPISQRILVDKSVPLIGNPAPLKSVRLEENPKIARKVEYLVSDTDVKAQIALKELYKETQTSTLIKILSVGLLGLKKNRKLVPTRWAVTTVDDTLSKQLLNNIRFYPEISEILIFHGDYVGNHYEFLLLPEKFSFEVIEAYMPGSSWNSFSPQVTLSQDYEGFNGRKKYADSVTGAYYTARLVLCEYLSRVKKQAACLVMREERPEYYSPLGVGILRELGRAAFLNQPEKANSLDEAFKIISQRLKLPISLFRERSWLLKNYKKQARLSRWI